MSKILCIIDGMTDPQFDARDYPSLSSMRLERCIDTTCGYDAESFGCILRLLGVRNVPVYSRGYAEALGAGIPVGEDDLVLRGSWYGLDAEGRCTKPVPALRHILGECECHYHSLGDYKSLLVFPGEGKSVRRITTYPPYDCLGKSAVRLCPQGSEAV
jgi:2,3-bisphosphoglycerate-independent phosphoglycerate mutase